MTLSTEEFAGELSREIRARRSFGGHPLWERVEEGASRLALHSRCLDAGERAVDEGTARR